MQQLQGLNSEQNRCDVNTSTFNLFSLILMHLKVETRYLSFEILFKLQAGDGDALLPLTRPSAQQLNDLKGSLQTFPCLHPLQTEQTLSQRCQMSKRGNKRKRVTNPTCSTTSTEGWVCQNEL